MGFLMHVVAHVPHYLVFDRTLPFHLFLSAWVSEFRFLHPIHSLHRKLWFKTLNSKIRYHTATLWAYYCMCWLMSLTTLSLTQHYLTFSFTPLRPTIGIWSFSSHVVAYIVRHVVTNVPHYLVFDTTLPFLPLLLARVSEFGFLHLMS